MASNILPPIGDFLSAFAQGKQGSDVRQNRITQNLLGQIQGLPQGDVLGSEALQQLRTVSPQQAQQISQPIMQLDKGRRDALFTDAIRADKLLEEGFINETLELLENRDTSILSLNGDPTDTREVADTLRTQGIEAARRLLKPVLIAGQAEGAIPAPKGATFVGLSKDESKAIYRRADGTVFTETTGIVPPGDEITAPAQLLKGLSTGAAKQAKEAFILAGGGADGVKALNAQIALSNTQAQRADVPAILDATFPNASPQERAQLEAAVQAGKTVESGLKQADKIRTDQRRFKKAGVFKARAVELLDGILANKELPNVLGSIEGAIDFRFDDNESELIADIQETQNILTAENMDLMTGVLSESDIQLLKNLSSGALNRRRGEVRFRSDVEKLRDKLKAALIPDLGAAPPKQDGGGVTFLGFE